jgi:hypothetical protein
VAVPLDKIPVFVKAGSFIPMATSMLSTDFYHNDTLLVWYYPDKSCPYSSFDVYSDDGETKDAFQKGEYELITFSGDTHDDNITVTIAKEGNEYTGAPGSRELVFDVKRIKKRPETVLADGTPVIMAADSEEFHSLPAAWYWDEPANILRVHFRWESESSLLAIAGADLGIEPLQESYPAFILYPPFPNPFPDQFRVKFRINLPGEYAIRIQNAPGQVISQKTIHIDLPGMYDFKWDGKDDKGTNMGNGIYILTLGSSSGQLEMVKVIRMGDRND